MDNDKKIELHIPSTVGSEKEAMETAAKVAKKIGFSDDRIEDLKTAVSEACLNAIEHGNQMDISTKVGVTLTVEDSSLHVAVHDEGKEFGGLLKAIEEGLSAYWKKEFPEDPLERVYIACFYESSKHLHLHIVPRPKSFKEDLHLCAKACSGFEEIDKRSQSLYGWHIHLATKCYQFPNRYLRDEGKSKKLIEFLKTKLPLA